MSNSILYIGYPLEDFKAPHQAMAALYLARQGCEIAFLTWGNIPPPNWLSDYSQITYRLIPKNGLSSAFIFLWQIIRLLQRMQPDIVYVQGAQHTPFVFWLLFQKVRKTVIYHTQDYLEPRQHKFYQFFERFFSKRANWVVSNEPNRARFMASNYGLKQMPEVIRTALPSWWTVPHRDIHYRQDLLERLNLAATDNPRLVVAGGSYNPGRMSREIVEALNILPRNYALIFSNMPLGYRENHDCEQQILQLNIAERILFIGSLSYSDLLLLYAACDIGILLYPNSGIGHFYQAPGRMTEYLRCGLPFVASNFPGLELLTLKYGLGSVADPYDPHSIASAISKIGDKSDLPLARDRLISLANHEFVYEHQADKVFKSKLTFGFQDSNTNQSTPS